MQHPKGVVGRGLLPSAAALLVAALAPEMRAQTLTDLPGARLERLQEPPSRCRRHRYATFCRSSSVIRRSASSSTPGGARFSGERRNLVRQALEAVLFAARLDYDPVLPTNNGAGPPLFSTMCNTSSGGTCARLG